MTKKQKNIALVVGFFLALIICYQFALSNTLEQRKRYNALQLESKVFENSPKQLSILNQKETYYDSLLEEYQLDDSSLQNNLLKTINTFAEENHIKVINFLEPHISQKNELTIKTYQFVLEGDYNSINKLIFKLELDTKFGEIINLHFEKKKNFKTGRFYLQAKVLLRSFE
ncbi:hypothetical protein DFQ05_1853 [Winogradskyella wandonensis]|uniref:Uncharacterized protein n=1 Tax=Winogradskyella wandonensis TaxID=1442586 RepID=A0A4R1KSP2_9FLAO|nr:hypothetical protein [Winogradskyella wandonensis]TCK68068.1 hypothetical protein DFQ05_1853 [Winogradskyella wandonensis]